jgi:AcrR family transcriptional regulator
VVSHCTLGGVVREERRDAAGSRRKILGAARRLFKSRGVDHVSMHEVGRAAGAGQGTLYRRFEHKGALCSALLAEQIEYFYEETWERMGQGRGQHWLVSRGFSTAWPASTSATRISWGSGGHPGRGGREATRRDVPKPFVRVVAGHGRRSATAGGERRGDALVLDLERAADTHLGAQPRPVHLLTPGAWHGPRANSRGPGLRAERDAGCRMVGADAREAAHSQVRCKTI